MSGNKHVRSWVLVGVSLVVLVGIGWFLYQSIETVERVHYLPPSAEARRNPALAAERFLNEMGLPTESARSLSTLPPPDHVLIQTAERRVTTHERTQRLLNWVSDGGFLIVGPFLVDGIPTDETYLDPLLDELDLAVFALDEEYETETFEMDLEDDSPKLAVAFSQAVGILSPDDEDNYVLTHTANIGEGTVLFLNDLRFAYNDTIGENDHAAFLWEIVQLEGPRAGAVIVYADSQRTLMGLLFRHAWLALLGGAVLLAFWVKRVSVRFGSVRPARIPERRSLMEHIAATGRFLHQKNRHDALVESVRGDVLRRAARKHPEIASKSPDAKAALIASAAGLEKNRVLSAVIELPPDARRPYLEVMRTLQQLRSKL